MILKTTPAVLGATKGISVILGNVGRRNRKRNWERVGRRKGKSAGIMFRKMCFELQCLQDCHVDTNKKK